MNSQAHRILAKGDTLRPGDQWFSEAANAWLDIAPSDIGKTVLGFVKFRRLIFLERYVDKLTRERDEARRLIPVGVPELEPCDNITTH